MSKARSLLVSTESQRRRHNEGFSLSDTLRFFWQVLTLLTRTHRNVFVSVQPQYRLRILRSVFESELRLVSGRATDCASHLNSRSSESDLKQSSYE